MNSTHQSNTPANQPSNGKFGWLLVCGVLGATAVAIGAVAAHALADPRAALSVERASNYQLFHAIALIALLSYEGRLIQLSRWFMLAGILGFSGAIYAKYLLGVPALGSIAPVGGSLLILSWLVLAVAGAIGSLPRRSV